MFSYTGHEYHCNSKMLTAIPSFIETLPTQNGSMLAIDNVPQSAYPLLLADLATQTNALALVLVETSQKAQDLANALHFYLGNDHHGLTLH